MAQSSAPQAAVQPAEQTLNVKVSITDPLRLDQRQMLPEKAPPSLAILQQIKEWWKELPKPARVMLVLLALVVIVCIIYLMLKEFQLQPRVLAQDKKAEYQYILTGSSLVVPYESTTLQLMLVNTTPLTTMQPLTNVVVLMSQKSGALPLAPDRAGWLMEFGDLPPSVSATREVTVTLNDGHWFSPALATLDFQVKSGTDAWQSLGSVDLGAYPVPGATRWKNTLGGATLSLLAVIGLAFSQRLVRILGLTKGE